MGENGHAERSSLAASIAELVDSAGLDVAVAESLTGGMLASVLAEAPRSSRWFRGAVVAYASEVKHELLNVPPGPVVSAEAAATMADEVRRLLRADLAVALTGAGGPRGQDGQPPGTVFLGLSDGLHTQVKHYYFDDDNPAEVCARTVTETLRLLLKHLSRPVAGLPHEEPPSEAEAEASTKVSQHPQ
jgi:nicotinamide-nucleotide amidase